MIDKSLAHSRTPEHDSEDLGHVYAAAVRALEVLEERYRNELMGEDERLELRERILRARRSAGIATTGI